MKWNTLYHKLGDFPARKLSGQAYVLVENPHTGRMDRVYLKLKTDAYGKPYLIGERTDRTGQKERRA